jgi:hypothetical protein
MTDRPPQADPGLEADLALRSALSRLAELLERIGNPRAADVRDRLALLERDPAAALRRLDANDWWAGAGSLAAETMADNPGWPDALWLAEVRAFRALLIEIGEILTARGAENPGRSSWLLAFHNWNASEI